MFNNYYHNDTTAAYRFSYGIGAGYRSEIIAQNNAFKIAHQKAKKMVSVFKDARLTTTGNIFNGQKVTSHFGLQKANWQPKYKYHLLPAKKVAHYVLMHAGNTLK